MFSPEPSRQTPNRTSRWLLLSILIVGSLARIAFVDRPVDHRSLSPWREADYVQVARSFHQESMNPLNPRIDWRGDTSGIVEMELPVVPWTAALLYPIFGYHEEILRVFCALCSVCALLLFARLARRLLPPEASLFATAAFAFNGLLIHLATSIQPESLLVLLLVLALTAIARWVESDSPGALLLACLVCAAAILVKGSAAFLGFVIAYFVYRKHRFGAVRAPSVLVGFLIAVLPPLLWYGWAHHHYLDTGLSLGLSNEAHFLNLEVLRRPFPVIKGNLVAEARDVFAFAGIPLALCAFLQKWRRIELVAVSCAAVALFYVLAADTSGDHWAFYYHSLSVPPACLLMGWGFASLVAVGHRAGNRDRRWLATGLALGLAMVTTGGLAWRGVQLLGERDRQPVLRRLYECCAEFQPHVPRDARIVVRGGTRFDPHGHPVAYNASMAFAWMDRKGFNYAEEDLAIPELRGLVERGATHWLVQPADREDGDEFARIVKRYSRVTECDGYALYDLRAVPDK